MVDMTLIPDFEGKAASTASARAKLQAGQKAEETGYLDRYRGAIAGQETVPAMYSRIARETGMDVAGKNVAALNTQLANLPYTYGKATRGFDVNANQLERITAAKAAELAPTVTAAANQYASAKDVANTLMSATQTQQAKELQPYTTEQSLMTNRIARETSGFTEQAELEYNGLVAKMNAGITLSEGEKNRAAQLEAAKMQRDAQLEIARMNQQKDAATGTGGRYSTSTGEMTYGDWG